MNCKVCQSPKIKHAFSKDGEDFYHCLNCDVIFQHPLNNLHLSQLYENEYFNKESRFTDQFINWHARDNSQRVLGLIKKFRSSGALLDIGAAYGQFLQVARDNGFQVSGIEPNKESVRIAKEKFNLNLQQGFFDKNYHNQEQFDVITNFHVIEHVLDPLEFVRTIRNDLKNGGIAVFETPNTCSINFFMTRKKNIYILPNEHIFLFSPKSLGYLLKENGLKVIYQKRTGIFWHKRPKSLAGKIYSDQASICFRTLNKIKNFCSEKLMLGDHLFIIAQKI